MTDINLVDIMRYFSYWVAFWTVVNIGLPPREIFGDTTPNWYNVTLRLVAYYGSLNLRQFSVKLYAAVNQAPPPEIQAQNALDKASAAVSEAKEIIPDIKKEDK